MFTTTVADGQGAFVLQMNSGQWAVGSGQFAVANTPMPTDETAANVQLTARCPLPTAHYLELAFGEMGLAASVGQETAFGQPGPVLNSEPGEQVLAETQDLAALLRANGVTHTDWTSDNDLAHLGQSVKHDGWISGLDRLDSDDDQV